MNIYKYIIWHITKRQRLPVYEVFSHRGGTTWVVHKIGSGGGYIATAPTYSQARDFCDNRNLYYYRLSVEASFPYPINRILLYFIPKPK